MLEKTILFDLCHNEMLNIDEKEYSDFRNILENLGLKIRTNSSEILSKSSIGSADILVIGNPINDYFSNQEIKTICDYVRIGGSLLLISEYGADFLQKTNLNDLSGKNFGIFFEKNLVQQIDGEKENSIITLKKFNKGIITDGLRRITIGGACSLFLNKNAKMLLLSRKNGVWSSIFNSSKESWIKQHEQSQILAAYAEFGQGKVIALGDIDIFTNDESIGINAFDNHLFLQNCIKWLMKSVDEPKVMKFILNQIGILQNDVKDLNNTVNNIIETITILEKRISIVEEKLNLNSASRETNNKLNSKVIEEE